LGDTERPASPLAITLFGTFDVRRAGCPLPPLRSQKGRWLLALLVMQPGRALERAWLAGLLWPDSTARQAAYNLSRNLTDLRHAAGPEARRLETPSPHWKVWRWRRWRRSGRSTLYAGQRLIEREEAHRPRPGAGVRSDPEGCR
jgi:hypothetical protein